MRIFIRNTILIGVTILFFGCSFKELPPVDEYRIVLQNPIFNTEAKGCQTGTLKVLEPYSTREFALRDMHYVILPFEENSYTKSAWKSAPERAIYSAVLEALRKSGLFLSVSNYTSIARSRYTIEMEINDFKQYFNKEKTHSYVVSDVTFTLVETKGSKVIAQKKIYAKIKTKTPDAKGGVVALNEALQYTMNELVKWLNEVCV